MHRRAGATQRQIATAHFVTLLRVGLGQGFIISISAMRHDQVLHKQKAYCMTSAPADKSPPPLSSTKSLQQHPIQLVWLSDGRSGHDRQSQALVSALQRALGQPPEALPALARVNIGAPWRWFAPLQIPRLSAAQHWPQLPRHTDTRQIWLIGCGRRNAQAIRFLKQRFHLQAAAAAGTGQGDTQSAPQLKCIQILDPRWARDEFDLLLLPEHDPTPKTQSTPVWRFPGSLHPFDWQELNRQVTDWPADASHWPRPWLGLLLGDGGGLSLEQFWAQLEPDLTWAMSRGGSILFSSSRRTPDAWRLPLAERLARWPGLFHWADGATGESNPYHNILRSCDELWIGGDSVNMLSEALSCPQTLRLANPAKRVKHQRWLSELAQRGLLQKRPTQDGEFPAPQRSPLANPIQALAERMVTHFLSPPATLTAP